MDHPKAIGDRSTLAVILALRTAGFDVLMPFGENTRYDLVIDDGTELRRVQCKTGRLRGGAVLFNTCSTYGHHRRAAEARRDYRGQIDLSGVYCPGTESVYLIPIADVGARWGAALRVEPTRNRQKRRVRTASRYEIAKVSVTLTAEPGATAGAG